MHTGHLRSEELARAVASADIMLSPSTTEAFGNVVLEAMAARLAVVSADVPSARALFDDQQSGLLACPNDITSLANAVTELIENAGRRRAIGTAAQGASAAYS